MATIASLFMNLTVRDGDLQKKLKKSQKRVEAFERSVTQATKKIARFGVVAAAAAVTGMAVLVRSQLRAINSLAKTADKLGITTEALAGLQHAAELSGVESNTLNMALQRMTRRVSEAAMGTGEAVKALDELGISASDLNDMAPDQQFFAIANAMQGVANQADRVRLAMRLFDSEGVALVNTLAMGEDGLREAMMEARRFGLAISRVDAAKVEAANDAITRMKASIAGFGRVFTVEVAPFIEAAARKMTDIIANFDGRAFAQTLIEFFRQLALGVSGLIEGLGRFFDRMRLGFLNMRRDLLNISLLVAKIKGDDEGKAEARSGIAAIDAEMSGPARLARSGMRTLARALRDDFINGIFDGVQRQANLAALTKVINFRKMLAGAGGGLQLGSLGREGIESFDDMSGQRLEWLAKLARQQLQNVGPASGSAPGVAAIERRFSAEFAGRSSPTVTPERETAKNTAMTTQEIAEQTKRIVEQTRVISEGLAFQVI